MSELYRYIQGPEPITPRRVIPLALGPGKYRTAKYKLVRILRSQIKDCDVGLYRLDGRSVSRISTIKIIENKWR